MDISIISVFPELYKPFLETSLIKRAQEKGLVHFHLDSFFSYVAPKERIDAPTFGHGSGMLIKPLVIEKALEKQKQDHKKPYTIFFSPQGRLLDQTKLKELAHKVQDRHLILVPSRYEGMDERVQEKYADDIISIGDYVLMGGDLPAMVLIEGLLRHMPGVVGKADSVAQDSFTGPFVDYPEYTEPVVWQGMQVPEIVRSGNHEAIAQWRKKEAVKKSVMHHFTWVQGHTATQEEKRLVIEQIPAHYVALCHSDVLIGNDKQPGTTSVTSIDIHDIARSCKTYGVKNYWIVTPLLDQQKIVSRFLGFWASEVGLEYNPQRREAIAPVALAESADAVIKTITAKEGVAPVVIATSARSLEHKTMLTFFDQQVAWQHNRPILLLLGTGKGLTNELIEKCDYLLDPIEGFSDFNHLSVRSAAAIILDRWLGIHRKKIKSD